MGEADQLCERLAIIDHGKLVAEGTPAALKAEIGADVVTVRLRKDADFEARRARALDVLKGVAGVERATPFDEGVSAHAAQGGETLIAILEALDAERIPVQQVALAHPSLDEVFLQHTGREMRVEDVRPPASGPWGARGRR